jgi:2-oxoglutarate ferredoxin oxidoreductase subunit delta
MKQLTINETRCKGCNLCTMVCPYRIFQIGTTPNKYGIYVPVLHESGRCANCRLQELYGRQICGGCALLCPDQAISWIPIPQYKKSNIIIEY